MKAKKPYHVDTGNQSSWYTTLPEAVLDFDNWCTFYSEHKGYGNRTIRIKHNKKIIRECPICE
jgi:hypothetical protein